MRSEDTTSSPAMKGKGSGRAEPSPGRRTQTRPSHSRARGSGISAGESPKLEQRRGIHPEHPPRAAPGSGPAGAQHPGPGMGRDKSIPWSGSWGDPEALPAAHGPELSQETPPGPAGLILCLEVAPGLCRSWAGNFDPGPWAPPAPSQGCSSGRLLALMDTSWVQLQKTGNEGFGGEKFPIISPQFPTAASR